MPESVTVNPELNIIEVWSYGAITHEDLAGSLKIVERFHQERGINQLLIDLSGATSFLDTIKLYSFFSNLPQYSRIAICLLNNSPLKAHLHFIANVAYNKRTLLRVFTSKDEALAWLKDC
jgi:hypothetical protein